MQTKMNKNAEKRSFTREGRASMFDQDLLHKLIVLQNGVSE